MGQWIETPETVRTRHAVKAALQRLGPNATYEAVSAALEPAGLKCSETQFKLNLTRMYPDGQERRPKDVVPAIGAAEPPRSSPVAAPVADCDKLGTLIRFMAAVELVGGVAKARSYLDVIETMGRKL